MQAAAAELGLEVRIFEARSQSELQGAFEAAATARAEALLVLVSPTFAGNRAVIAGRAAQHRLPAMYYSQTFTEAGGLIAYGPPMEEQWRLAATAIDKVLKGTRPTEIPVQRPTRLELDVNVKAARELGLDIPQSILLRANRVME